MIKLLERHFEIALETPNGITKLRELILSLAMQGKLVPQDPKDEPASELLKKIEAEKKKLTKEGKIKRQNHLVANAPEEVSFELPKGWRYVRLGEVVRINPRNNLDDNLKTSFIPMALIADGFNNNHGQKIKLWEEIKSGFTHFSENDVGVAKITPCFQNRKSVVFTDLENGFGAGTTELYILRSYARTILPNYLLAIVKSREFIDKGVSTYTGTAGQQRVKKEFVCNYKIGLPPFKEQKRIVTKINELMTLCDRLEEERRERDSKRLRINSAAINQLISAPNKVDLNKSWKFIEKNFHDLYSVKENVTELKKAILQLAVMGKLLPQDPKDEPARELLKKIESEKKKLIKEGKIKREKLVAYLSQEEIPYELPNGWEWIRLGEISQHNSGKTLDRGRNVGIPREYITTSNLYWGFFKLNDLKVMPIKDRELEKCSASKGDLLICEGGEAGRAAIWESDHDICFQNHIHRVRLFCGIQPYYIYRIFQKISSTGEINQYRKGVGISNLSGKALGSIPIPLPPVPEQERIVAKIDQLMEFCNSLEKGFQDSFDKQEKILNAVLAKI